MINNVVIHFTNTNIPFGGIRNSGIGNGHGFYGFKAFSHEKSVMKQRFFTPLKFLYPPYTKFARKIIKFIIKYL